MAEINLCFITTVLVSAVFFPSVSCEDSPYNTSSSDAPHLEIVQNDLKLNKIPDFSGESTQLRPDTEEDLMTEMEELFKAMRLLGYKLDVNVSDTSVSARMKMSDFMFNPLMLVPQLIMWGFAPIILANLKMFVMQALMLNKMALNAAIFMTLRNIVFGPRPGPIVKYANYGYHNNYKHHHSWS